MSKQVLKFKTKKNKGKWGWVNPESTKILLNSVQIGNIAPLVPHTIGIKIYKDENYKSSIYEDEDDEYYWIYLNKKFNSINEAEEFFKINFDELDKKFKIYKEKQNG